MKKKNTKGVTKCSQYNEIMTVINEFQQLNLFVFELHFYVVVDMLVKLTVKFVISLALLLKKSTKYLKKIYIFIKFGVFYCGRWGLFLVGIFFLVGSWAGLAQVKLRV